MPTKTPLKFAHCRTCPVSKHNPFKVLPDHVLQAFSTCKTTTPYKKKQIIFHHGQHPYGIHCIGQGKVKESIGTSQGKDYITRISQPGDLLGYHAFLRQEPYNITAEAMEDVFVCFLDQAIFNQVLLNHPQFNIHLMNLLCQELKVSVNKAVDLAYNNLPQRVAELLLLLNTHYGEAGQEGIYLNISITRKELASMLGTTVESVVRELSKLQEKGILTNYKRHMIINKLESLSAIAS